MSDAIYPVLPGLAFSVKRTARFKTDIKSTPSGREFRGAQMSSPVYRYGLVYSFLRDASAFQEMRTLLGFYTQRKGPFDSFLFDDPDDRSATSQGFGAGDGITKTWQLVRTFGGNVEPVYDLNGSPQVYVAGVLKALGTDYTLNSQGGVTFTTAPTSGQALTWTGLFYWRCRFAGDELDVEKFAQAMWEAKKVEFITFKP